MAMEGLRGYVQLASGLADMSRAKAMEAASALLSLSSGLAGGSSGRNVQVQDLAEELLAAAAANRRSLVALVRGEVERAIANSPIPPDELDRARAAVAKLSADVEELRAQVLANPAVGEVVARFGLAGHATSRPVEPAAGDAEASGVASMRPKAVEEGLVVDAALTAPVDEPASAPPRRRPPRTAIAGQAATKKSATKKAATKKAATKKAATKKAATKKAATKKAATKKAVATKSATKKAGAKPATATTSAAKKSATKKSATKKSAATTSTAKKSGARATKGAPSRPAGTS
ncbi:MAG TPA: hypothetical protein VNC23_04660 [Lapillicoccus sp.]|jgi:hypothetical protein|nr:hypothetical protein [Lapillicoccus sp.]